MSRVGVVTPDWQVSYREIHDHVKGDFYPQGIALVRITSDGR